MIFSEEEKKAIEDLLGELPGDPKEIVKMQELTAVDLRDPLVRMLAATLASTLHANYLLAALLIEMRQK